MIMNLNRLPKITPYCGEYYNKWVGCDKKFLKKSKYIYLHDHMPASHDFKICFNDNIEYSKNSYTELLISLDINPDDKIFITDDYTKFDTLKQVLVDIENNNFLFNAEEFLKKFPDTNFIPPKRVPEKKLTFMSNKPRPNRMLASRVISNLFNTDSVAYTYIKNDTDSLISDELLLNTNYAFKNKSLNQYWIQTTDFEKLYEHGIIYSDNASVFSSIKDQLYYKSTTSTILEPAYFELGNMFTEKTIMSIYSGHFLIWPGMYKSAETFKNMGFDIFEDIIDHSYQYLEHPGERVVEAFSRNIDFLNDIDLQNKYREQMLDRLNHNLQLIRNPEILKQNIVKLQIGSVSLDYHAEMHKLQQYLNTL